jgi:hypothetical protein
MISTEKEKKPTSTAARIFPKGKRGEKLLHCRVVSMRRCQLLSYAFI